MDVVDKTEVDSYLASDLSSEDTDVKTANSNRAENKNAIDSSLVTLRRNYWLGLGMHITLVLVHIVLIAVLSAGHLENQISVPLGKPANIASVAIVVSTQVVNQVFLVGLVLIVQQLALRRTLHTRQTLTAVHDQYNAWSGFGAACVTLLKQYRLRVSVWTITGVTGYLLAISVLHITVPATLSLATFNKSISGLVFATSNMPNFTETGAHVGLESAALLLPMISTLPSATATTGLLGNVIFDTFGSTWESIWPFRSLPIYSDFFASATIFQVTCGLVNSGMIKQSGIGTGEVWNITVNVSDGTSVLYQDADASIKWLSPYLIRFLPLKNNVAYQTALFYASVNITDNQGRNATQLILDPPMKARDHDPALDFLVQSWQPTVFACNMHTQSQNVSFASDGSIYDDQAFYDNLSSTWKQWQQPKSTTDPLELAWGSIFDVKARSMLPAKWCSDPQEWPDSNMTCNDDDYLTIPEKFLNDKIGLRLANNKTGPLNGNITLWEVEQAIEEMTAAMFWSAANYGTDSGDSNPFRPEGITSFPVELYNPAAQLNLNSTPLLVGFFASITLIIIFLVIIRTPENSHTTLHAEMTMTGLLQLVWLLGRGSSAQDRIAEVDLPTTDNLRKAAKFEVCMDTLVRHNDMDTLGPRCRLRSNGSDEELA